MDKETREEFTKIKIDKGISDGISRKLRTICISAVSAMFAFFVWLGSMVYDKFPAFKAAIITFIQTDKGIK